MTKDKRDWQKDMRKVEAMRCSREVLPYKEYLKEDPIEDTLAYWLQEAASEKARADEMLSLLERIKADVDQFRDLTRFEKYETVEEQAAAYNKHWIELTLRTDAAEAREQRLKDALEKLRDECEPEDWYYGQIHKEVDEVLRTVYPETNNSGSDKQ